MATHKEYNGWYNYETWAVKLWIDNEQPTQEWWLERAHNAMRIASRDRGAKPHWTLSEHARFTLADELKAAHEEGIGAVMPETASVYADLLGAALSEVNWNEIADALLEGQEWDGAKYERKAEDPV